MFNLHKNFFSRLLCFGLAIILGASACNYPVPDSPPGATPGAADSTPPLALPATPTATPTPPPPRALSICLTQEPASLFLYADSSQAARAVRQAIYDGPLDQIHYGFQAVILEKTPRLGDGDASLEPVTVELGSLIVDADGQLATLSEGRRYLPSGCREAGCALAYSGNGPVTMDQLAVRFVLLPGMSWSDGTPMTAADSVYSYEVARALYPQARAELIQHTDSYQALDERSVEWRGVPGYVDPLYASNYFHPLPEHAWQDIPPEELAQAESAGRAPLGWGAYVIEEWVAGDHISLVKNTSYFRAAEGLPPFDRLVYRFIADGNEALLALQAGECDLIDEAPPEYYPQDELVQAEEAGRVSAYTRQNVAWEQLAFGIQPAETGAASLLQAKETRQAIALCADRQRMVETLFNGRSQVMHSYVAEGHPLFNPDARRYEYDSQAGAELLQGIGWVDLDNDPNTPRQAQGIIGVLDGTPLQLELLTLVGPERQQAAQILQESLTECGIGVEIRPLEAEQLFAPGPDGPIFGRSFDLAQFGWTASLEPRCDLYTTAEIPGPYPQHPKGWGGANASGYSNPEYDQACLSARSSLPEEALHTASHQQAQAIFAEDLPVLPLYSRYRQVVARPDLCGLDVVSSLESIFWNLEVLDYGEGCPE